MLQAHEQYAQRRLLTPDTDALRLLPGTDADPDPE
jgi:hypothetical protein